MHFLSIFNAIAACRHPSHCKFGLKKAVSISLYARGVLKTHRTPAPIERVLFIIWWPLCDSQGVRWHAVSPLLLSLVLLATFFFFCECFKRSPDYLIIFTPMHTELSHGWRIFMNAIWKLCMHLFLESELARWWITLICIFVLLEGLLYGRWMREELSSMPTVNYSHTSSTHE